MTKKVKPKSSKLYIEALALAKKLAITGAVVEFSGSGDSGDIEEASLFRARLPEDPLDPFQKYQLELFKVEIRTVLYHARKNGKIVAPNGKKYTSEVIDTPEWTPDHLELSAIIDEIADNTIGECEIDWTRDLGGWGDVQFDLVAGKVILHVYQEEEQEEDDDNPPTVRKEIKEFSLLEKRK